MKGLEILTVLAASTLVFLQDLGKAAGSSDLLSPCSAVENPCNPFKNLKCVEGQCKCFEEDTMVFDFEKDQCVSLVGGECDEDVLCVKHAECRNNQSICECQTNYVKSFAGFCSGSFGTQCGRDDECMEDMGLACLDNLCVCANRSSSFHPEIGCVDSEEEKKLLTEILQDKLNASESFQSQENMVEEEEVGTQASTDAMDEQLKDRNQFPGQQQQLNFNYPLLGGGGSSPLLQLLFPSLQNYPTAGSPQQITMSNQVQNQPSSSNTQVQYLPIQNRRPTGIFGFLLNLFRWKRSLFRTVMGLQPYSRFGSSLSPQDGNYIYQFPSPMYIFFRAINGLLPVLRSLDYQFSPILNRIVEVTEPRPIAIRNFGNVQTNQQPQIQQQKQTSPPQQWKVQNDNVKSDPLTQPLPPILPPPPINSQQQTPLPSFYQFFGNNGQ